MSRFIRTILIATLLIAARTAFGQTVYSVHYNPQVGYEYCRLVQVDFDGQETISKTVATEVMENKQFEIPTVYPNPAVNTVNIAFNGGISNADIKLGDMMGNILIS